MRLNNKNTKIIVYIFFIIAFISFIYRGPLRAVRSSDDYSIIYIAASKWLKGHNPYAHETYYKTWIERGGAENKLPSTKWRPSVYPITIMPLVAPFSMFSWNSAKIIWLIINLTAFFAALIALHFLINIRFLSLNSTLLIASILTLSPLNDGITQGNPVVLSVSFLIISILMDKWRYDKLSGGFLGISLALKPHVAIPIIVYFILKRNYIVLINTIITAAIIAFLAIIRGGMNSLSWLSTYINNVHSAFSSGGANDPCTSISKHAIISIHYLVCQFPNNIKVIFNILFIFILISIIVLLKIYIKKNIFKNDYNNIFLLGTICTIFLLPIYHRNYDGLLLILPLSLIFTNYFNMNDAKHFKYVIGILILIPFSTGGPVQLEKMVSYGIIPDYITTTFWWRLFVMPFKVWSLIILLTIMLYIIFNLKKVNNE